MNKREVNVLNPPNLRLSAVSLAGQALSILLIGVTVLTTVNFGIYWTFHLPQGAHYYPMLGVNILLCSSLVVMPILFRTHPILIFSKTYLALAIFLITFFISGFLYLFNMFDILLAHLFFLSS